jgi:hypothetical protein
MGVTQRSDRGEMAEKPKDKDRTFRALFIAYLVWHCVVSAALVLMISQLVGGALRIIDMPALQDVHVILGVGVAGWVLAAIFSVLALCVIVLGFLLAFMSRGALVDPARAHACLIVSRVLFLVCLCGLVYALFQADAISFFVYCYSLILTCLIMLSMGRLSERAGDAEEGVEASEPRRPDRLEPEVRLDLTSDEHACRGYTAVLRMWGFLKVLMGIVFVLPGDFSILGQAGPWFGSSLFSSTFGLGLILCVGGIYNVVCGLIGKREIDRGRDYTPFVRLSLLAAIVSGFVLVASVATFLLAHVDMSQELFAAVLDAALAAAVLFYARRIQRGQQTGPTGSPDVESPSAGTSITSPTDTRE